jgi:uncharacterized protein YggE
MNLFPPRSLGVAAMLAAAGLFVVTFTPPAGAEEHAPPPRTVRVSGSATVKAAPDRASIAVSVVSRAATAREASEAGARTGKTVLDTLRGAVQAPGEVKTAGYDLSPEYDYDTPRSAGQGPKLVGYVVTNRFSIVTDDLAGLGALIDASVGAGANQIDSIGFFLDDEEAARRQALLQAGQKARSEAETVAQSLGVSLGEVLDASTESNVAPPMAYGRKAMMMEASSAPPTEVVPGSLDIVASVSVTFAIR